jgi:hypothetical protein
MARMVQVIGLCDSYLYWPLVRLVYAHRVFCPALGKPSRAGWAAPLPSSVQAPEGRDMLARFPALSAWWAGIVCRPSLRDTQTPLPNTDHGG